jgi:gamma-glutamyltranspeptidase/glutathione hydrolase
MNISTLALGFGALLAPLDAFAQCLDGTPPDCVRRAGTMAGRSTVYAPHAMIATSQPLASAAGLAVLQRGGNAIDAAVTAAAVLAVVEPHMTGVGGDMFAMLWSSREGHLVALNASGRSGSLLTREELVRRGRRTMPSTGAETITVPGALSGWAALLQRYGTISLADALAPAIRLAEEGFPVTPVIASEWSDEARKLQRDDGARATFLVEGTRPPRAGEWFRNPDLAASLRLIARDGPSVLYGGELGRRIVDRVRALGGFLTLEDLQNHQPMWVEPISAPFKGYRVWELPPNNQGVAVLEMLRMLEPFDLAAMGHNSARYLHTLVEAKKLAYADLARYVGDPDHLTAPPSALLTDEFIARRRALLDTLRASDRVEPGEAQTHSETIYLTAADSAGNMISFINSQYDLFGSGVVVPGTGFSLQDRGAGFTMTEGLPNTVGPRKRPFHTLIPGFVTKTGANGAEEPWLSFGVMGGSVQPQGHVQVLLNLLVFGMDPQQAVDAGRFRHISGRRLALEPVIGDDVRAALTAMGHDIVRDSAVAFGGAQLIMRLPRGYAGASDPRKDGLAIGW